LLRRPPPARSGRVPRRLAPDGRPPLVLRAGLAAPGDAGPAGGGRHFLNSVAWFAPAFRTVGWRDGRDGSRRGDPLMNERSIFIAALEKGSPEERAAYLEEACAGDAALRRRVEALLGSHEGAGNFLGKPGPQLLAEELAARETPGETRTEPA